MGIYPNEEFMNITIFTLAIVATIVFYLLLTLYRYLSGKWQWSPLFPGRYIFPKRISSVIRPSVICAYKVLNFPGLKTLEDYIEERVNNRKMTWLDFVRYNISNPKNTMSEDNFKYFLFLKQASVILFEDRQNGLRGEISRAIQNIHRLNNYFSTKYVRRAIKTRDRNVILAEALYQVLLDLHKDHLPYGHDSYRWVSNLTAVQSNSDYILTLSQDPGFRKLVAALKVSNSCIYSKEILNNTHAILFHVYIVLLIKWQ